MKNIFEQLIDLLKKDERLVSQDGILLKNQTQELARKNDPTLLKLLLSDKTIKQHFFFEIEKTLIFDKEKFIRFVSNKQFLPDSYTAFKNKIGLTANDEYVSENKEVVLAWPYKDCVLEGGMTKEDQKRDEIFYNETLAPDDINRLLDAKVFTNFKRIDKKGEHKLNGFNRDEKGTIKDNLIIKGNNLLALASLKKEFAGKVKLIYIDPPYNTGNDGFKYNDSFNHSSWLVFIKNRLEIAKILLSNDGVIFIHCDNNEQAYLKVMMDEIFDRDNFIDIITVVNNPRGRDYGGIAKMHEFINVYAKSSDYKLYRLEEPNKEFPFADNISGFEIRELRNRNVKFNDTNRPNLVYPFFVNSKKEDKNGFFDIGLEQKTGWVKVMPAKSQGIQTVWRWGREKSAKELNINICGKQMQNGGWQIVEKYREKTTMARSVWWDKNVNSERGTLHLKEMFGSKLFDYPKPEETLHRIIEMATRQNDLVLDFFAGSGTTLAVAHKTGRQYIGIEQMDYIHDLPETRLKKVIAGEQGGISEAIGWKGGGDFGYMELAKWNEKWIEKIEKAKTGEELSKLWGEMKETAFLSYKVDPKTIDANAKDFADLSAADQKKFLIECLDKNQLYINLSEIEDKEYEVSKEDKALNKNFYNGK
ncbi:restriction endonuclease subunit M [Candidatus Kuenenbacteria bacterium HGW-Kuenenbacteria-1]|uniref:Restriction endonuclease subunit M n=1 Tax=Candidatus Kuenenbacteria bacterium HGW-Kuenenbacteria-1 TaxID=2013812 RepID=A0A2N1UNV0_9BACT|nr:MAG: restriction endonuclease subunit M [Candidatus Kuenenbacteria bacterium HGW-Kuenenbacteria-1]